MKRLLVLFGSLGLCGVLSGCGTDPREGLVAATLGDMETAATKVSNIKLKIEDAVKKTDGGKAPDFKEAISEVDSLKKIATEMKNKKNQADALKDTTTQEERTELEKNYKERVKAVVERLSKAKEDLNKTLEDVDKQHKEALKEVRKKLVEADGEFEAISRLR